VQNESSEKLLQTSGVKAVTVTGDTRLDRVVAIAQQAKELPILESIKNDLPIVVLGSVWPSDIEFLLPWIERTRKQTRFVIAPHNTAKHDVTAMQEKLPKSTLYSELERVPNQECSSILLIDNMGLLASIYAYAKYTYVGGAWRGALHNTVEPAAHGKPVFFGAHPKNRKFMEAGGLVQGGGAYEVSSLDELELEIDRLEKDPDAYQTVCKNAKDYVSKNSGASKIISEYVLTIIS
jgi:3-deoxy-D-manno-octulosonic-acid transferase